MSLALLDGSNSYYAADSENVYFEGAALKGADPKSWKFIGDCFSADSKGVYFHSRKLPRVNVETWLLVSSCFSRDNASVFYMNHKLKGADPDSWVLLGGSYSRDSKNLYFGSEQLGEGEVELLLVSSDIEAKAMLILLTERLFKRALSDDELEDLKSVALK